jgi:DNA-directed RNA polymerase subunit RPC12/RpoP
MRIGKCMKCGKEGPQLTLVHNKSEYQYQYEECKNCGNQVFLFKRALPKGFDDGTHQSVFVMKGWDGGTKKNN